MQVLLPSMGTSDKINTVHTPTVIVAKKNDLLEVVLFTAPVNQALVHEVHALVQLGQGPLLQRQQSRQQSCLHGGTLPGASNGQERW